MQSENICKFIVSNIKDGISVKNFIYERDEKVLRSKITLAENRLYLFTAGKGSIYLDGHQILFKKGSMVFAFEGETAEIDFEGTAQCMYISFDGVRAQELFYRFAINKENRQFEALGLIPLWQESLAAASEKTIDLVTESMLLYAFSRLEFCENNKNNVVTEILRISEKNFSDSALSVESVAEKLGYNAKYISQIFKKRMKIGYCEYLRSLRIKYAVSLFESGLDSVKNVAFLSGFSDPLYFSTVFKKSIGMSPKEYIKKRG